jgi:virginiamycin B lyase
MSTARLGSSLCVAFVAVLLGCTSDANSGNFALPHLARYASQQGWTNFPYAFSNGADPAAVALGADGDFWIADSHNGIVRMDVSGHTTLFTLPPSSGEPGNIIRGNGYDLWFTGGFGNAWVGKITTAGVITLTPLLYNGSYSVGIAKGLGGTIWFTDQGADRIGRISANGTITEFPIPTANSYPQEITLGPDGDMWFTESFGQKIGRITMQGAITEFPSAVDPTWISSGPGGRISYASMPGSGESYIYIVSTDGQTHQQVDIGRGVYSATLHSAPKGDLWATVFYGGVLSELDRITSDGFVTQFPPQQFTQNGNALYGFAFAHDGSMWIADPWSTGIDVFRRR